MTEHNPWSRRDFIQRGTVFASMASTVPVFLQQTAAGAATPLGALTSSIPGMAQDRIFVVVQLGGGNDGLNTIVPHGMDEYYRKRPSISISKPGTTDGALASGVRGAEGLGFNPAFSGFKSLMDDGRAAVIQGVGYPNPNRSHFSSMDIWHSGNPNGRSEGWLGRYFDNTCNGTPDPQAAVAIGSTSPLALIGRQTRAVSFEKPELYRWTGEDIDNDMKQAYRGVTGDPNKADDTLAFLRRTAMDAQISSSKVRQAASLAPLASFPGGNLSDQLRMVAAMIRADLPTRVYYVTLGGFDTHANQAGQHARLLQQVGDSLKAFSDDLKAQGNDGRVLTMVFSEFGRRVAQNGSGGTDHGTAAPLYLIGPMVKPGFFGRHPSLTDLDSGDLKYTTDFRQVYASVLEDWLKTDSAAVLHNRFQKLNVIA
ncbi:MAG: DUF1501 domain-containing protein [Phycisphaerales bacterium]|nr:DUF1501 domain-containing protein [Phycisphaerales bacterium]